jgi:hypothetical protein
MFVEIRLKELELEGFFKKYRLVQKLEKITNEK